jgi:multicomponent Na+:H+ antiporter subunit D
MISQAASDGGLLTVWLLLAAASAGVFLHAGIKFPWFVFFQKDSGLRPPDPPASMKWAMGLFAFLCIALGVWTEPLYSMLPYPVDYVPYTAAHVLTQLQLLLFSGLAFFLLLPMLKRTLTITLDTDWVYRRLLPSVVRGADRILGGMGSKLAAAGARRVALVLAGIETRSGPSGVLARTWPIRSMALWVLLLLVAYLVLYYV